MEYLKIEASSNHPLIRESEHVLIDLIFRHAGIPLAGRLLDIGPGKGLMAEKFLASGMSVSCVDIDPSLAQFFLDAGCEFKVADLRKQPLPFADGVFDVVYCSHVIEHLQEPLEMLAEVLRVLRPGGFLILRTPDLKKFKFNFWDDPTHVHPFIVSGLRKILILAGYEVIRCSNCGLPPIRGMHRIRAYRWAPSLMFSGIDLLGVARKPQAILPVAQTASPVSARRD